MATVELTQSSSLVGLNRFHRLALWCMDCDSYWQLPNYLVVLHGKIDVVTVRRLLKINLYLYGSLFNLDVDFFGPDYHFAEEVSSVFEDVRLRLRDQTREIKILDIDLVSSLEENMSALVDFVVEMKGSFDGMAFKILEYSPKNFLNKLKILRKNILRGFEQNDLKTLVDNMMDLNIAGLDVLVQCVGIIFNCFYLLNIDVCEPVNKAPGTMYCTDQTVVIERLANISAQSFLYKYKRRWLVFYREMLAECRNLFTTPEDLEIYRQLRQCGNYETIERELYRILVTNNSELMKQLTILRHNSRYPKECKEIYEWWSGRSKEQLHKIYNCVDDCLGMDKKTGLLPFILTHQSSPKDRIFHDIQNVSQLFSRINPDLSNALGYILRIYPDVFEQVYFPDRERYTSLKREDKDDDDTDKNPATDVFDNIRDKNTLRKCENKKCQERHGGRNVVWNLNTFEAGKHSINTVLQELIKNPQIFDEILSFAKKNLDSAMNSGEMPSMLKKLKIVYKK